ncbi:MAG: hypothetical protein ACKVX7_20025 [Planctomycetota bacterium]
MVNRNMTSQSSARFFAFAAAATWQDGGERACRDVYDRGLGDWLAEFLDPGDWGPRPAEWAG